MPVIHQNSWLCMLSIPSVCLRITWYFCLIMHPGPTFIIGRSPWAQQSTLHHWSLTGWFPFFSTTRHLWHLFTLWNSCSVLDAISLIGGFLAFVNNFSSLVSIQRVISMFRLHLAHAKDAQGRWFMNIFFVQSPPNYEALDLFLVMNDERCLNSLLSLGLFPSTSTHLFQIWDLEFYEYLETCNH